MSQSVRKWLPFALCCAPGAFAAVLVVGIAFAGTAIGLSLNSPFGIGLLAVAVLACPVSMILMMRSMMRAPASKDAMICCAPQTDTLSSTNSLQELQTRRAQLENEIAVLQQADGVRQITVV